MIRLYAGLLGILLLGFAFWYVHKQSYTSGVNAERTKWQDIALDTAKKRAKAENRVIEDRVVWRDRIQTIEKSPDTCVIPADILRVLHESGLYVGPL